MTEAEAYVAFNMTDRIGPVAVARLAEEHGSVSAAWSALGKKVSRSGGEVDWEGEFRKAAKYGVRLLTLADDEFPARLRGVPGSPSVLYVRGSVEALSAPAVALIGTRRATSRGRDAANRLAYDLAKSGWAIVSGLALGIDAAGHRGALDAGGVTVGVIGSALDEFYPEANRPLAREIIEKGGAVVSQFPFGRPPDRETFPIRNHVVAALAAGVVAVEAPARSGTLITVGAAADLGRPVMAMPGRVDDRMSAGCLSLIRDGATLVRNADDVIEELSDLFPGMRRASVAAETPARDEDAPAYSAQEAIVMLHVDDDGVSVDDLPGLTGLTPAEVTSVVMTLRVKGFVRFLPGNRIAMPLRH